MAVCACPSQTPCLFPHLPAMEGVSVFSESVSLFYRWLLNKAGINQGIIYSQPSIPVVPPYPQIQPTMDLIWICYWKISTCRWTCAVQTSIVQGSPAFELGDRAVTWDLWGSPAFELRDGPVTWGPQGSHAFELRDGAVTWGPRGSPAFEQGDRGVMWDLQGSPALELGDGGVTWDLRFQKGSQPSSWHHTTSSTPCPLLQSPSSLKGGTTAVMGTTWCSWGCSPGTPGALPPSAVVFVSHQPALLSAYHQPCSHLLRIPHNCWSLKAAIVFLSQTSQSLNDLKDIFYHL